MFDFSKAKNFPDLQYAMNKKVLRKIIKDTPDTFDIEEFQTQKVLIL